MAYRKEKTMTGTWDREDKWNDWPVGQRRQMNDLWDREDKWLILRTEKTNEINGLWNRKDKWMTCGTEKTNQMNGLWDREDKSNEWPLGQKRQMNDLWDREDQMKWHEYPKRHVHQQLVTSRSLTSRQPHRISSRRASTVLYHTVKTIPAPRGGNNSPDHQQEI